MTIVKRKYRIIIIILGLFLLMLMPERASAFAEVVLNHNHSMTVLSQRVGVFEYQTGSQWYNYSTALYFGSYNITVPVPFYCTISGCALLIALIFLVASWGLSNGRQPTVDRLCSPT
jgi:hypothetical protein